MPSITISPEQEATIISACKKHESQHILEMGYKRCVVFEDFFIKFDSCYDLIYPQYMTQKYISELAATNPDAPHIPEIYHFFTSDSWAYLVMERIEFAPTSNDELSKRVAKALQWLHDLPIPADAPIGSLGGGIARHVLFISNDDEAPLHFSSIGALERYMNTALLRIRPIREPRPTPIDFSHESLMFTQSDMDVSNFGVDKNGKTCLSNFEAVGLLPQSFVTYTMSVGYKNFACEVARHMDLPPSCNLSSMRKAAAFLAVYGDPTLGLDNDGMPKGN